MKDALREPEYGVGSGRLRGVRSGVWRTWVVCLTHPDSSIPPVSVLVVPWWPGHGQILECGGKRSRRPHIPGRRTLNSLRVLQSVSCQGISRGIALLLRCGLALRSPLTLLSLGGGERGSFSASKNGTPFSGTEKARFKSARKSASFKGGLPGRWFAALLSLTKRAQK